jgi:menaquinol-cytochrome c reductase iron-sulfur subunit
MPANDELENRTRRSFIFLLPVSVFAGVFSSIAVAAFRFLRPRIVRETTDSWTDVALMSELKGEFPVAKKITADHISGWALTREEHQVYVLPGKNNQVLSAVCPHEGCEVAWDKDANRFSCPCHESYFAADGARVTGPARRGLDSLPSRIQDGKLQVQYQSYENNTAEQIKRS